MDDSLPGIESLEEEDLLYFNSSLSPYYDDDDDEDDDDNCDDPMAITDTININSLTEYLESSSVEDSIPEEYPVRSTKGIPRERFVSYDTLPSVQRKPFVCEVCGLKLATKESLKRHILSKHVKERLHVCDICNKSFIFKFALKAHSAIHSSTPKFVCICGMTFKLRNSYMDHIQRIHRPAPETKPSCELCFKSFGDRHTLRLHMISVHKPKTIPCIHEGCSKIFSSINLMRSHYRYHLNQKFTCDECGQSFSTESYKKKHALTHSGVRPYVCLDCGNTYISASHRNQHRRRCHLSVKLHQCSFCGKCFKAKDLLTYHESNHKGEKPFKCEDCGYATAYKNRYYAHRKKNRTGKSCRDAGHKESHVQKRDIERDKSIETKSVKLKKLCKKPKPSIENSKKLLVNERLGNLSSVVSGNENNVPSLISSYSPSSASFFSNLSTSPTKDDTVDFIIFSPDILSNHVQQGNSSTDSNVLLSTKQMEAGVRFNNSYSSNEQFIKEEINLTKGLVIKQDNSGIQKSGCTIMLSNNGVSSNSDNLLLLVKPGENELAKVSVEESPMHRSDISEGALNSFDTLNLAASVNSRYLSTELVQNKQETNATDPKVLMVSPLKSNETLLDLNSVDQSSSLLVECDPIPMDDSISLSLPQLDGLKPSSSHMYPSEDFTAISDIDASIPSLSGHFVDDSFHLNQLEVICPLCDEQFFCMDMYITHLECVHN